MDEKELSKMKKDELINAYLNLDEEYVALENKNKELKDALEAKEKTKEKQNSLNYFALLKIIENNTTTRLISRTEENTTVISTQSEDRTRGLRIIIKDNVIVAIYNNLISNNRIKVIYNAWLNKLTIKR